MVLKGMEVWLDSPARLVCDKFNRVTTKEVDRRYRSSCTTLDDTRVAVVVLIHMRCLFTPFFAVKG